MKTINRYRDEGFQLGDIVLKIVGIHIGCEVMSCFRETDAVIKTEQYIYIFEFKMGSAQSAIDQIKKKKYCAPYLTDPREIILTGFSFDKQEKNLVDFITESLQK